MKTCLEYNTGAISQLREAAAYEALWCRENVKLTFKKLAQLFSEQENSLPSSFVQEDELIQFMKRLKNRLDSIKDIKPQIIVSKTFDYPDKLKDAIEPVELLYYTGNINYLNTRGVAIVGTRHPSENGLRRARNLVKLLIKDNFTIYSGLAEGIDTMAHQSALRYSGRTVAVIGTPINEYYPKNNKELQLKIAKEHLLISQVPFFKYEMQDYRMNRLFFPERNKTMSALAEATIIIEAGDTSGSLIQAKAALQQRRKLFILQSCFENPSIKWPEKFEKIGAIRVRTYDDIQKVLL